MVGDFIQVDITNGKRTYGTFHSHSDNRLVLIRGNSEAGFARDNVSRVYRITGDTTTLAGKLFGGVQKGAEVTEDVVSSLPQIYGGSADIPRDTLAIGAAAGAAIYLIPTGKPTRVLAFAK